MIHWLLKRLLLPYRKIDIFDACDTPFRVNLLDIDFNMHMNNGRYLTIMDIGRFDLLYRSGIFGKLFKAGFYPVVASESIRFKRSLKPFQKFVMRTQIESLSDKDFFISQKFIVGDKVYAEGYIKGRFKRRGVGSVPTKEVFNFVGKEYSGEKLSELAKLQTSIQGELVKARQ